MFLFTRMGWLVPAIWLAAVAAASQVPAELLVSYEIGLSRVAFIFLTAAAMSTHLVYIAGAVLNKQKSPRTIKRFGKDKVVHWGSHTFNMLPVEYWAAMIPAFTIVMYAILSLV